MCKWEYKNNELIFSGTGSIELDYDEWEDPYNPFAVYSKWDCPWDDALSATTLVVGEGITSIGRAAFKSFKALTKVILPEGLLSIGADAFKNCISLENIKIPSTVESVHRDAFTGTPFEAMLIEKSKKDTVILGKALWKYSGNSEELTVPEYVAGITKGASDQCSHLKKLVLKNNELKVLSLAGCTAQEIVFSSEISEIPLGAFKNCAGLRKLILPEKLKSIDWNAFSGCSSLQEIVFPTGLENIDVRAFKDCKSLQCVNLANCPNCHIAGGAFLNCTGIKKVILPSSCEVEPYAFAGCSSIESVMCDKESISPLAFRNSSKIELSGSIDQGWLNEYICNFFSGYDCDFLKGLTFYSVLDTGICVYYDNDYHNNGVIHLAGFGTFDCSQLIENVYEDIDAGRETVWVGTELKNPKLKTIVVHNNVKLIFSVLIQEKHVNIVYSEN